MHGVGHGQEPTGQLFIGRQVRKKITRASSSPPLVASLVAVTTLHVPLMSHIRSRESDDTVVYERHM